MKFKDHVTTWNDGVVAYTKQEYRDALDHFHSLPQQSRYRFNLAVTYMQLDCIDYACRALEQCIQLDPYLSVAYFVYGCLLFDQAKYQDALDHFDHALVNLRGNGDIDYRQLGLDLRLFAYEIHYNKGCCYAKLEMTPEAEHEFQESIVYKPEPTLLPTETIRPIESMISECLNHNNVNLIKPDFNTCIYKPSQSKVQNVGKKNYLGKSRVVAAIDEKDVGTGFAVGVVGVVASSR